MSATLLRSSCWYLCSPGSAVFDCGAGKAPGMFCGAVVALEVFCGVTVALVLFSLWMPPLFPFPGVCQVSPQFIICVLKWLLIWEWLWFLDQWCAQYRGWSSSSPSVDNSPWNVCSKFLLAMSHDSLYNSGWLTPLIAWGYWKVMLPSVKTTWSRFSPYQIWANISWMVRSAAAGDLLNTKWVLDSDVGLWSLWLWRWGWWNDCFQWWWRWGWV